MTNTHTHTQKTSMAALRIRQDSQEQTEITFSGSMILPRISSGDFSDYVPHLAKGPRWSAASFEVLGFLTTLQQKHSV